MSSVGETRQRLAARLEKHECSLELSYASGWRGMPNPAWDVGHDDDEGRFVVASASTETVERLIEHLDAGHDRREFE